MNLFKPKDPVLVIAEKVDELITLRGRIVNLLHEASVDKGKAEERRQRALSQLDAEEAELALSGDAGPTQSRRELTEASIQLEAIEARLRGLNAKLDENFKLLASKRAEMEQARKDWNRQQIQAIMPEYTKAVAAFAAVNRKLCALGEALGEKPAIDAAQNAAAFSPLTGEFILEDAVASGHEYGWVHGCWDPDWEGDPKAKAVYESHRQPADACVRVDGLLEAIRNEAEVAEVERRKAANRKTAQALTSSPQ